MVLEHLDVLNVPRMRHQGCIEGTLRDTEDIEGSNIETLDALSGWCHHNLALRDVLETSNLGHI